MAVRGLSLIEAPSDLGLRPTGVARLPAALRSAGLLAGRPDLRDAEPVPVPPYEHARGAAGVRNATGIRTFSIALADRVSSVLDEGRFPLVLGGDCSILLGPALALTRRGRFGLLFLDGHADFYTPEAEPNGEVASMDLAIVTGHGPPVLDGLLPGRPMIREEDVVLLGFRDADNAVEHGSPDVRRTAIRAVELGELRRQGAAVAGREAVTRLEALGVDGFWIHLDADVLHDGVMPAVDYRMPDGLHPEELQALLDVALASGLAIGMDVTIYNPALDSPDLAAAHTLAGVLSRALGGR